MNNPILTQPSVEELRQMFREELSTLLSNIPTAISSSPSHELLNIAGASRFLNLSSSAVYSLVQRRAIPHMKRARRLYFSKEELLGWVKEGRKHTQVVLQAAAKFHLEQVISKKHTS